MMKRERYSIPNVIRTEVGIKEGWTVSDVYYLIESGKLQASLSFGNVTWIKFPLEPTDPPSMAVDVLDDLGLFPCATNYFAGIQGGFDETWTKEFMHFDRESDGYRYTLASPRPLKLTSKNIVVSSEQLERYETAYQLTRFDCLEDRQTMEGKEAPPAWYRELEQKRIENRGVFYESGTIEEFCGRFDLSYGKALAEIRRCKLWNFGIGKRCKTIDYEDIYARLKPGYVEKPKPVEIEYLPLPEFDRYAEIIAAEREKAPSTPEPVDTAVKKALPEGMRKPGDMGTFKTFVNEALKLKTGGTGVDFLKHIRDCYNDKGKYPFLKEVTNIQYNDEKRFVCFLCEISKKHPEGLHWYSKKRVTDMWSHLKNNPPEK